MAKLTELRSIPLTSPVTVAHFCRLRMCSMSVNGYASTKVRYRHHREKDNDDIANGST